MQRWVQVVVWVGAVAVAVGLPGGARADYWRYTKDDGSPGFADELKQVPARYREQAVRQADQPLGQYSRYTRSAVVARKATGGAERVEGAVLSSAVDAQIEPVEQSSLLLIEVAPEVTVPVLEESSREPVRVDRHVLRWDNGRYRSFTIVRRGEQVISEIEER